MQHTPECYFYSANCVHMRDGISKTAIKNLIKIMLSRILKAKKCNERYNQNNVIENFRNKKIQSRK